MAKEAQACDENDEAESPSPTNRTHLLESHMRTGLVVTTWIKKSNRSAGIDGAHPFEG